VSSLKEYFHTDWEAMTAADWVGTGLTVGVFLLMVILYFYVLRPKNKERLESHCDIPFRDDDRFDNGESR